MKFIETSIFTKQVKSLLDDEEYRQLQNDILINPEVGKIIPHSNGLRKMRFGRKGEGKRGGLRVIYYWVVPKNIILMLMAYSKSEKEDLTPDQLKILRSILGKEFL